MVEELILVEESQQNYFPKDIYPFQDETFKIIGLCMEVHRNLGKGFLEIVYKDALQHEFKQNNISFEREVKYEVNYKGVILPHYYVADFVLYNNIILEVKAQVGVLDEHYKQLLNYLAASKCKVGLLANFGENSVKTKRLIL